MKFRKKPVVIDARLWDGDPFRMIQWLESLNGNKHNYRVAFDLGAVMKIPTLEGEMTAQKGDWIICGVKGELYPCKPEIFEQTYEPAE